jgi:hypothetical protein
MDYKLSFLILKNTAKLEKLIKQDAPYSKILKQSQLLDKYIAKQMIKINKIKR